MSSTDLNGEFFGRRFNQQPIAIFDLSEPSDTRKAMVEFYPDMNDTVSRGILLTNSSREVWLHKAFLKGHLVNVVAR